MSNIDEEIKKQIEVLQGQIDEIKADFAKIVETVEKIDYANTDIGAINDLLRVFSKLILAVEESGKKYATLFVNKSIQNDSTELSKYLHHSKLKMEGVKDAFINKDKNGFTKGLSILNRNLDSSEYLLSLFIGEATAEITKVVFKQYIDKKASDEMHDNMVRIMEILASLKERMERCEGKISLLIRRRPQDFLEEEEARVFNEMLRIHSENVQWVEPRFLDRNLPIPLARINEILDNLLQYGLLDQKLRGGMKVYKYRFGENNDFNKD
ncbi:MAG TPA: hypothetical protein PK718_08430 [Candidatus Methanofastidiosa archaeon]|nr:hypothetical protein [Candidatus Methanofastidiosa archaeon]HPR42551.1 hypothetical protein [Candidatus Methanofastidiosa archaeon]